MIFSFFVILETQEALCRKTTGKPYYYCRIQSAKKNIPVCKAYLCSKPLPVAHLNYEDVDELIELIGVDRYYEEFDYSACELKTHKKLTGSSMQCKQAISSSGMLSSLEK